MENRQLRGELAKTREILRRWAELFATVKVGLRLAQHTTHHLKDVLHKFSEYRQELSEDSLDFFELDMAEEGDTRII
jgi:hypothetical protein